VWATMWGEEGTIHSIFYIAFVVMTMFAVMFMVPYLGMVALGKKRFRLKIEQESEYGGVVGFCFEWRVALGLGCLLLGPVGWYNLRIMEYPYVNPKIAATHYEWVKNCSKIDYNKIINISVDIPRACVRDRYEIMNWYKYGWQSPGRTGPGDHVYYRVGNDAFHIQCGSWGDDNLCDVGQIYRDVFVVDRKNANSGNIKNGL
jgi:hypothetical protein